MKKTTTSLALNLSNHSGSLVAYHPNFILSCELSRDGFFSKPSLPWEAWSRERTEQCPLWVAGTLYVWAFIILQAGQEAGGTGQEWVVQVSPDDNRVTRVKWTVPMWSEEAVGLLDIEFLADSLFPETE